MDLAKILTLLLVVALHTFDSIDGQKWGSSSGSKSYSKNGDGYDKCATEGEPIKIPFCKGLPYTQTIFPNLMGNQNQDEAGLEVHQYYPLVKIKCSKDIQFSYEVILKMPKLRMLNEEAIKELDRDVAE